MLACSPAKNCCLSPTPSWAENCSTQHQINFPPVRANKTDHAQAGLGDKVNLRAAVPKIEEPQLTGPWPESTFNESLQIRDRVWKPDDCCSESRSDQHRYCGFFVRAPFFGGSMGGRKPCRLRKRSRSSTPSSRRPCVEVGAAVFENRPLGGHSWLASPVALHRAPTWHAA